MSKALYRTYRSRSLADVVGQSHVTDLLARALKQDRVAHAYLFTGPKGVGKTSIARILAHEINGLPYSDESTELDIIEIDAASNNGVEDIRDLREKVQIAPVSAKKKIYIIDEVHMLSKQAFNALLKTLEEPPEHVVFILATTDIDKVPDTIQSRTQRHTFRRASIDDIVTNLERIAKGEKVKAEPEALRLIAKHSDGSFRDSVSLFDQLINTTDKNDGLTRDIVATNLGLVSDEYIEQLLQATVAGDTSTIVSLLTTLEAKGTPPRTIVSQLSSLIQEQLGTNPEYVRLLDSLLDVMQSSHPDLKLLTTLSLYNEVTAPPRVDTPKKKQPEAKQVVSSKPKAVVIEESAATAPKTTEHKAKTPSKPLDEATFDWKALLAYVKEHHVAFNSVLSKCEPSIVDGKLVLYTNSAFYKKKLDDSRYQILLTDSLAAIGAGGIEVETNAARAPMKDSHAAKVAAIMGGGEEVSVEDVK